MSTIATQIDVIVHRNTIYLANNERGNRMMDKTAKEYADQHKDCWPLIVTVNEHAGWHLSYLFGAPGVPDGAICGTANAAACLSPAVLAFGKRVRDVVELGYERRE